MELSVMTFNLRYDEVKDGANAWPYRADKVVEIIRRYRPFVVGTQEGLFSMLTEMSDLLEEYEWIGQGREAGREGEHNAIFYNADQLRVLDSGQFWLSEQPMVPKSLSWESSLPRICTWTHFASKTEPHTEMLVFNTHLDHRSQTAREKGIALIWETINRRLQYLSTGSDRKLLPIFLMGDFNAFPDNPAITFLRRQKDGESGFVLRDVFASIRAEAGSTFHGFKGGENGQPIDYVFVSQHVRILDAQVIRERIDGGYPSDHYPVRATISIDRVN